MMRAVPAAPLSLDEVAARWPTIRQSWASNFDDCPLSSYFDLKYAQGWSTTPQARGQLFHRAAAEILRTMRAAGHRTIPVSEALEILLEVCHQRDVPADEIVRVPMRTLGELRMAVTKFAKDNEFSTDKLVAIEEKLEAPIRYVDQDGEVRERTITGTLDALLYDPPDGAIVLDWKDTWGLPPEPKDAEPKGFDDEELKGISYHGYFQQRWYGYLVLRNYSNVNRVTLREFYHRKTVVRKATLHRHQMPDVEAEIGILIAALDAGLAQGAPDLKPDENGQVDIDALGRWKPSPGKHCGFCSRPTACPIEEPVRVAAGGAATSPESAARWAARWITADRIRKIAIEAMKGYVEEGGEPIPVKWAKGRQVIGWFETKRGRRFGPYVPAESDRGVDAEFDAQLKEAMRESTARARAERGVKPKRTRRAA